MSSKLRIVVLTEHGASVRSWQRDCLQQLTDSGLAELVLRVSPERSGRAAPSRWKRAWTLRRTLLFRLFNMVSKKRSPALQLIKAERLLEGLPAITCRTERKGRFFEVFSDDDIAAIRSYQPDIILRFGFGIIHGEILNCATYGVWSYHHGDVFTHRGSPPAFWEYLQAQPVVGVTLQRLTETLDGGVVLFQGHFGVEKSYSATNNLIHREAACFVRRVAAQIIAGHAPSMTPVPTDAPIYKAPTNGAMCRYAYLRGKRFLRYLGEKLFTQDMWNIGIGTADLTALLQRQHLPEIRWSSWPNAKKGAYRYLADPFGYKDTSGKLNLLVEDYSYDSAKGHIARIDPLAERITPEPVINIAPHLSYPSIVKIEGTRYCIPEAGEAMQVRFFRQRGEDWEPSFSVLEGIAAIDPTYLYHDNTHWLFFSRRGRGIYTELEAYYSDELEGEWAPHPLNPLVVDVRRGRMGGNFIQHDGALYRVGQDCSQTYGGAVSICRVDTLTRTHYVETLVGQITPDENGSYPHGLHTLNLVDDTVIIDGKKRRFSLFSLLIYMKHRRAQRQRLP